MVVVDAAVAAPLPLLPPLTKNGSKVMLHCDSGINNTYMPLRLRFWVRACRASSSKRC